MAHSLLVQNCSNIGQRKQNQVFTDEEMVRILNETEVCLGEVTAAITELRPPLPRINHNHNGHGQQINNNNMDSSRDKDNDVNHLGEVSKEKVSNNCCPNISVSLDSPSSSPEPSSGNIEPTVISTSPSSDGPMKNDSNEIIMQTEDCSSVVSSNLNGHAKIRVPIIVIEELPVEDVEQDQDEDQKTDVKSREFISVGLNCVAELVTIDNKPDDVNEDSTLCECDKSPNGLAKLVPLIVVIESADDKDTSSASSEENEGIISTVEDDVQSSLSKSQDQEKVEAGKENSDDEKKPDDSDQQLQHGDINIIDVPDSSAGLVTETGDGDASVNITTTRETVETTPTASVPVETPVEKDSKENTPISEKPKIPQQPPTNPTTSASSLLTGRPLMSRPTSLLTSPHVPHINQRNHGRNQQHHCPAHHLPHQHHSQQVPTTFQLALSHAQAAAAANNLSNLLSQSHLQFQPGNFPNFRLPHATPQHNHQNHNHLLNPTALRSSFANTNAGLRMHHLPPTNHNHAHNPPNHGKHTNIGKNFGQQNKFQQYHNQHQNQTSSLNQLQRGAAAAAVPMQLGYFGEQEVPPWGNNALCNGPGPLATLPSPLDILSGLGSPSSGPLPTAIIPLPLDPNFPPVVLPSYPTNTNTPNTQSTSGYSTAGHSRSSSPMSGPTNAGPGLLHHFDNGLLPLPQLPPCSSSGGSSLNPNFILAAASTDLSMYPQFFPNSIGQYVVYFHINPSVSVCFSVGDQSQVVKAQQNMLLSVWEKLRELELTANRRLQANLELKAELKRTRTLLKDATAQLFTARKCFSNAQAQIEKNKAHHDIRIIKMEESLRSEFSKMYKEKVNQDFGHIFTSKMLDKVIEKKKYKHWTDEDYAMAISIYSSSSSCYKYLRDVHGFPLPSPRGIQYTLSQIDIKPGLLTPVLNVIRNEFSYFTPLQRAAVLCFDEVSVDSRISLDEKHEKILGPHKNLMAVSVRGLGYGWKQLIYFGFDVRLTKELIHEIIVALHSVGIHVYGMVSDMSTINRRVWKELGIDIQNEIYYFENPVTGQNVWVFADVPHLIKLLRNHFIDNDIKLGADFNETVISASTISKLVKLQESSDLQINFKVTERHLHLNGRERMKVRPAMELFSGTTGKALQYLMPEYKHMADFFLLINDGMDLLNTRTQERDLNPAKCPFGMELNDQIKILDKLSKNLTELRVLNRRPSIKPFQRGFKLSCESMKGLFFQLQRPPVNIKYIITSHCNQDYLESTFGAFRGIGRFNTSPTPIDAIFRMKSLILSSNIRCPKTGNVHDENDMVFYSSQRLTLMKIPSEPPSCLSEDKETEEKLRYISRWTPIQVPIPQTSEDKAVLGAKEYLAGFIARKFIRANPDMMTPQVRDGWVNFVSRGSLITPSDVWFCTFLKFEEYFEEFHKRPRRNAWDLNTAIRVITPLAKYLKNIYSSIPLKVINYYVQLRTKIRITSINKKILIARREKRVNAFINSAIINPDDDSDEDTHNAAAIAEENELFRLDEVGATNEFDGDWELLDI